MNSETQRPSEDNECDSVKRAGSDFDLGKHNVSGELEAISGMDGKDAKFWPILAYFGYFVAKLRTF